MAKIITFSGRRNLMKRNLYKLTVLCMLVGTFFMSGCEGMNPVADMAKIQAADAASQREAETQKELAQMDSDTAIKLAEIENKEKADQRAHELKMQQDGKNPDGTDMVAVGTDSAEITAEVNTGGDESTVGSTDNNTDLAK